MAEKIESYRYGEGETRGGQVIRFTAPVDDFDLARDALQHFRDITLPSSARVNVQHGGFGRYSRYEIDQVKYGGAQGESGGGGYYEILDIKNPPEDRHPFVSDGYMSAGEWFSQFFAEWESIDAAEAHWEESSRGRLVTLDSIRENQEKRKVPGLIRVVNTGYLSPWFYATGNASLVGDYVFPEHLAQDPTYTFGRQFLVPEKSKTSGETLLKLKTCMGCVVEDRKNHTARYGEEPTKKYRIVQWHDGSITELSPPVYSGTLPIPLADEDTWVTEAQQKFNEMLSGRTLGFEVEFADGGKFVGKYIPPPKEPKPTPAGNYHLKVTFDNGKAIDGWVEFEPSAENPNLVAFVEKKLTTDSRTPIRIETTKRRTKRGGQKWPGVFHKSLSVPPNQD